MHCLHPGVKARHLPLSPLRITIVGAMVLCYAAATLHAGTDPFPQPIANPFEGRIQVFASPDARAMRFDIGASPAMAARDSTLRIRADFFTLSRMRSAEAMKFPVETVDYWFGLSASWASTEIPFAARLRLAHVSAHFVDGTRWPFTPDSSVPVYSREFAEVLVSSSHGPLRVYAGGAVIWSNHHSDFSRVIPHFGAEVTHALSGSTTLVAAYDGKLVGYQSVVLPQHCAQVGLVYRHRTDIEGGLMIYRYDGRSIHGMFPTQQDHYWAVGVRLGMP
ncbi:MAG: hypothetical protein ACKOE4_06700 [Candidatus Kapaibacterium sp.]